MDDTETAIVIDDDGASILARDPSTFDFLREHPDFHIDESKTVFNEDDELIQLYGKIPKDCIAIRAGEEGFALFDD